MESKLALRVRNSGHKTELCSCRDHLYLSLNLGQHPWAMLQELFPVSPVEDSSPTSLAKFCPGTGRSLTLRFPLTGPCEGPTTLMRGKEHEKGNQIEMEGLLCLMGEHPSPTSAHSPLSIVGG